MKKLVFLTAVLIFSAASVYSFGQELIRKENKNGKWGFVDKTTGEVIIPFQYNEAGVFIDGLAPVRIRNRWGGIDKTGNVIVPFKYKNGHEVRKSVISEEELKRTAAILRALESERAAQEVVKPTIANKSVSTPQGEYDIIILKNGQEIKAKVTEISLTEIKYKLIEHLDGPTRIAAKSDVFVIIYENGTREVISPTAANTRTDRQGDKSNPYKFRFYIGTGSGYSYGVLGTSYEARFNQFGVHAGVGWFPLLDTPSWSLGTKWYFWKNLYFDAIVGVIGEHFEFGYNNGTYYENHHAIIGLTPMFGVNWSWGGKIRFGVNAGVGYSFGFNSDLKGMAYDAGINISFGTR